MRIAVIAPPWLSVPPAGYGGTERVLDELCRAFVGDGHEVLLCATGDSTCPVERAWCYAHGGGTDHASPASELRHVVHAYDAVRMWGADVVHDHTITGPFYAAHHPDLVVVTTNHGPFDAALAPLYRVMSRRIPVIAISHHQASTAADIPIAAVIHHGVDVSRFPIGHGRGGYALFLGRMSPTKGVDTAIRVARRAGMPLLIAAKMVEPDEHAYFDARVRPLLGDGIEYVGEVGGQAKLALLADAVCLVNPIAWPEPFGMVMIEALACATPVLTTPCGAAPEIVEDGATGFIRANETTLAGAFGELARLNRARCRAAAEHRFSAKRMAGDHARLFDRLVHPAHPAGAATPIGTRTSDIADPPGGALVH